MGELIFWTGIVVMIICFFIEYQTGENDES
jgi:hypothetical protein